MEKPKKLRLVLPVWQGGMNPEYAFGSKLMEAILPEGKETTRRVHLKDIPEDPEEMETYKTENHKNGIDGYQDLLDMFHEAKDILDEENPDELLVIGGDCSASQVPFAWLAEKYGKHFGILWLDAHPDIANTENSDHLHEMVLANLLGKAPEDPLTAVNTPVPADNVLYAGLIVPEIRKDGPDAAYEKLKIETCPPESLADMKKVIAQWIQKRDIRYLAIHLDLDVISPADFRSGTAGYPGMTRENYGAALGEMPILDTFEIIKECQKDTHIVGLTIAEHMPHDALNLRRNMSQIDIFS